MLVMVLAGSGSKSPGSWFHLRVYIFSSKDQALAMQEVIGDLQAEHSAAMFLKIRDRIASNATHPDSPQRPETDLEVLSAIASELRQLLEESNE